VSENRKEEFAVTRKSSQTQGEGSTFGEEGKEPETRGGEKKKRERKTVTAKIP